MKNKENLFFVSIIIVNWNGKRWLKNCLDSVFRQTYKNFEIIFVDNGSNDGSTDYVKDNYKDVKIIQLDKNYGFSIANNVGIKSSRGDIIFLLNNDTVINKKMLEKVAPYFNDKRIGTIQPRIALMREKNNLDLVGAFWTSTTFLYYFGLGGDKKLKKYNKRIKVFSNKGAAMFIRKKMLDSTGLFDEDFWSYYEETDLCHRAWISGYECWYIPASTCYHANGGTSVNFESSFVQFHNFKNKLSSIIKNFETVNLFYIIPIFTLCTFGLSLFFLFKGKKKITTAILRSLIWNAKNIQNTLEKRKLIQRNRIIKDSEYLSFVSKKMPIGQMISLISK